MSVLAEQHRADGTPGRRRLVRGALTGALALGAGLAAGGGSTGGSTRTGLNGPRPDTPEAALLELSAGNARWRTFHERHPDATRTVRQALVGGQHPFAVILGCVDSRVPPELVFDQGLGDLMTVRSAGEVLDDAVLGSIAFGVVELAIPLVVVLGHQSCGAVTAAVRAAEGLEQLPGHLRYLAEQIRPAVDRTLSRDARVDAAVTQNVRLVRSRLAAEPDLAARVAAGRLAVVGARYELTSQRVRRIR